MIDQHFFKIVRLLKEKHAQKPQYNLFRVLRSDSDEVRLHSRFLGDALNPKGTHSHGQLFVNALLQRLDVSLEGAIRVDVEYKNIDLLLRTESTAIIIENKVYAEDQPKQLQRYYESMRDEGYSDIHIYYLTLDGKPPSDQSVGNLKTPIGTISYQDEIHDWINRCIEISAKDAPLREAFIQYLDVINQLTSRVDNMEHIESLKNLLLTDDNVLSMPALNQAYNELLVETQLAMWDMLGKKMKKAFGSLAEKSLANQKDPTSRVNEYVLERRNSKWICQMSPLKGYDSTYLFIEQDNHLYFGILCDNGENSKEYKMISSTSHHYRSHNHLVMWSYTDPQINFRPLQPKWMQYLSTPEHLETFTQGIVNELIEMEKIAVNHLS